MHAYAYTDQDVADIDGTEPAANVQDTLEALRQELRSINARVEQLAGARTSASREPRRPTSDAYFRSASERLYEQLDDIDDIDDHEAAPTSDFSDLFEEAMGTHQARPATSHRDASYWTSEAKRISSEVAQLAKLYTAATRRRERRVRRPEPRDLPFAEDREASRMKRMLMYMMIADLV